MNAWMNRHRLNDLRFNPQVKYLRNTFITHKYAMSYCVNKLHPYKSELMTSVFGVHNLHLQSQQTRPSISKRAWAQWWDNGKKAVYKTFMKPIFQSTEKPGLRSLWLHAFKLLACVPPFSPSAYVDHICCVSENDRGLEPFITNHKKRQRRSQKKNRVWT
jgi:hypothetical protein